MSPTTDSGVQVRGGGIRTEPLGLKNPNGAAQLERLGLRSLLEQLQSSAGREVNIMIYRSPEAAIGRAESVIVP